ncbi:MAG: hypothetical protein E6593_17570, partial [Clostridium sp.]|nr:hypothetical protein [Clostridium sp.]
IGKDCALNAALKPSISKPYQMLQLPLTVAPPRNKPLTLDQLRQMDDEPVWVCGIPGHEIKWTPGWRIIDGNRVALRQWNDAVMYLYFADYGRTWLAYARKPEQEEDHG